MIYSEFIAISVAKNLNIQYELETKGPDKYYVLSSYDGPITYKVEINSLDDSADVTDFETNYLSNSNKPVAPTIITHIDGTTLSQITIPVANKAIMNIWDYSEVTHYCNDTDFETFYTIDLSPAIVVFKELFYYPFNDHIFRLSIDGFNWSPINLDLVQESFSKVGTEYCEISSDLEIFRMPLNYSGSQIVIEQKRRTSYSGYITAYGILVTYEQIVT